MENECEALPGVAYPGVRDNRSTINTKTGYDDDDDIVGFNVPFNTLYVISETILWVTWPNQQCRSTEGQWLVNHVKGQSHQAQNTKR